MPHDLPKAYDPTAIEDHWAEYWVRENLFAQPTPKASTSPDSNSSLDSSEGPSASEASSRLDGQSPFVILLPPPNVTGSLHMGHMFEHTESDILARWRRMRGDRALWVPGTDHAGIATQMLVERQVVSEGTTGSRWAARLCGARVEVARALRRRHPWPDEAARRVGRLAARILHHGRTAVSRRARGLRQAATSRGSSIAARTSSTGARAARPPSAISKWSTTSTRAICGRFVTP
jgi:hypothetical protein